MPPRIIWTAEKMQRLMQMRWERHTWAQIALELNCSEFAARWRGQAMGAVMAKVVRAPSDDPTRYPLPAGHRDTWGALLMHTPTIAGAAYPHPVPEIMAGYGRMFKINGG